MRIDELIVYRIDKEERILQDISFIIDRYEKYGQEFDPQDYTERFYACMQLLIYMAGNHGFDGNLWHCYLTNVLVNHENSYSRATEIVGAVEGSINDAVLHDIAIFKELYDYRFDSLVSKLGIKDFDIIGIWKWRFSYEAIQCNRYELRCLQCESRKSSFLR